MTMPNAAALAAVEGLDGPDLPDTQAMAQRLGATGFSLNRYWVLTPPSWACPCCARTKPDICRLNAGGQLYGHLVEHHDHIKEHVDRRFYETAHRRARVDADQDAVRFVKRMVPLMSAFDAILVCSDCNEADPRGKLAAGAPMAAFSFAPIDLQRFIQVAPNQSHGIDHAAALAAWHAVRAGFERRLKAVDWFIGIALDGQAWNRPPVWGGRAEAFEQRAQAALLAQLCRTLGCDRPDIERYVDANAVRPESGATARTWRDHAARRLAPPPLADEIAAVAGTFPGWRELPMDWTCPCCGRGKAAIIQPSNAKRISFVVRSTRYCSDDRIGPLIVVCNECRWAQVSMSKEAGVVAEFVSMQDVQEAIEAVRNGAHRVRPASKVDRVIDRIRERAAFSTNPDVHRPGADN